MLGWAKALYAIASLARELLPLLKRFAEWCKEVAAKRRLAAKDAAVDARIDGIVDGMRNGPAGEQRKVDGAP